MEVSQVNDDDKASLGSRCAQGGSGYFMFISVRMDQGCLLRIQPGNWLVVQWSGLGAFTVMGLGSVPDWGTEIPKNCKAWPKKEKIKLVEIFIK